MGRKTPQGKSRGEPGRTLQWTRDHARRNQSKIASEAPVTEEWRDTELRWGQRVGTDLHREGAEGLGTNSQGLPSLSLCLHSSSESRATTERDPAPRLERPWGEAGHREGSLKPSRHASPRGAPAECSRKSGPSQHHLGAEEPSSGAQPPHRLWRNNKSWLQPLNSQMIRGRECIASECSGRSHMRRGHSI